VVLWVGEVRRSPVKGLEEADVAEIPKIAVIDDDESVRDALESLLKSAGFKAEAFASATEFLNFGHLPGLACMILDVRMPGMSGIELQDRLIASRDGVPIIFISAHADEEARARALASGAIAFLVKPFSDEALLEAIEAAIHLPRSH
jgi:FixJ family two-component response regulator